MELNKSAKQALTTLQGQISEPSDYILITKENAIFKNEIFVKTNTWENDTTSELSDILLNVGLYKNDELSLLKNENSVLQKKIEELSLKILQLENDKEGEDDEDDEDKDDEAEEVPKKKVSGKPASQEKIK